ncbi:MAG: SIMPL domain-containing protein [Novosphingobium sp.]|nr:SIMPL domain-containing protein [Novosphingobium sp.]
MKRYVLALVACALAPAAALAQQAPPITVQPGNTLLTVSAEGRSLRQPELAVFSAGVTTQGKTANQALAENSRAMARVISELKAAGIAERDIQTSNLSINPIYSNPERDAMMAARMSGQPYVAPPVEERLQRIIGYTVNNQVSVRQRRLGDYGKVIDTLVDAGANQVNGPMFQMDDADPALDEARLAAMKKARERAELYARAAGLRVLRILSISESGGYYGPPPVVFAQAERGGIGAPPPPPPAPVQAGELQLTANVTVLYELSP